MYENKKCQCGEKPQSDNNNYDVKKASSLLQAYANPIIPIIGAYQIHSNITQMEQKDRLSH